MPSLYYYNEFKGCMKKRMQKLFQNSKLTIYSGSKLSYKTYNPRNSNDIKRLCKNASIQEFISDKNNRYPTLLIFKSNKYNMGVVTTQHIKKNQTICIYLGEKASLDKETKPYKIKKKLLNTASGVDLDALVDAEIKRITHYAFEFSSRAKKADSILAHNKRSIAGFINHNGTDPNVKAEIKNNIIYYKAARNIQKGEQLVIDYGPDYDYPDRLYYIPCYENHLTSSAFLTENIQHYYQKPFELNPTQRKILQIETPFIMLPDFFYKILYKHNTTISFHQPLDYRLPIITLKKCEKHANNYAISAHAYQHNITPLMLACTIGDAFTIENLIKKIKVDIFAKSSDDIDALIVAIKSADSEKTFLNFAKPLLQKFVKNLSRIESLGTDATSNTALHILVEREWCTAIEYFDNKIFFDVIDNNGYDALLYAIAHGKTHALRSLLNIKSVKKHLAELLFAEDETKDDFVLKRALQDTPNDHYHETCRILNKVASTRPTIKRKLKKFLK